MSFPGTVCIIIEDRTVLVNKKTWNNYGIRSLRVVPFDIN